MKVVKIPEDEERDLQLERAIEILKSL